LTRMRRALKGGLRGMVIYRQDNLMGTEPGLQAIRA